jgi:uncharacterized protein
MIHVAAFLAGFLLRVLQIAVESSLYLLIGFLTAGALRAMVGPARLRRFFGSGRWAGPFRAWAAAATLLPVCALGVLPVLRELRRSGVRRDAVLTFALAAPMLNPVSLLYGVSYLGPGLLSTLALGTFLVAIAVGLLSGLSGPADRSDESDLEESVPAVGARRLLAAAVHAAREASGPVLVDIAAGVVVAGLVAAVLRPFWLAEGTFSGDPKAIPLMAAVAAPTYVTPEKGIVALPEMLKFRQSSGAMFGLIVLGVGVTAGHLSWIGRSYGRRTAIRWGLSVVALAVAGAYAVERLAPPVGTANADNDHFEEFTNPFDSAGPAAFLAELRRLSDNVGAFHWVTLGMVAALASAGALLRAGAFGRGVRFEDFAAPDGEGPLHGTPEAKGAGSILELVVPPRVVSAVAAGSLLAVAAVGTYAFYPSPEDIFRDMAIIKADYYGEIGSASSAAPMHHLDLWDRQAARLPVGAILRLSGPDAEARRLTAELRSGIHSLREATEGGRRDEARATFTSLQSTYDRCKRAYEAR